MVITIYFGIYIAYIIFNAIILLNKLFVANYTTFKNTIILKYYISKYIGFIIWNFKLF